MPPEAVEQSEDWYLARELYRAAHYDVSEEEAYAMWLLLNSDWHNYFLKMAECFKENYRALPKDSLYL